jgi:dTDP-4-dehydrorhamnose 3,5-epimerase
MPFIKTNFPGLLVFEPKVFEDIRGYFFESYNQNIFSEEGVKIDFVQDNQARSSFGVVRGLHFQKDPFAQTKLIRVLSGKIIDVAVDIRKGSPTYGHAYTILLSAENKKQLLVPKGFAHGYSVISETAEVFYKCDEFYHKETEGGISWNDPALKIDWQIPSDKITVSEKDQQYSLLENSDYGFVFNS